MGRILKRILFNLLIFFFGFKFYFIKATYNELKGSDNYTLYDSMIVPSEVGSRLVFNFYKSRYEFYQYRFGRIRLRQQLLLSIEPEFGNNHPDLITEFGNKVVMFNVPYVSLISERGVSRFLLDILISHIARHMKSIYQRQAIDNKNQINMNL